MGVFFSAAAMAAGHPGRGVLLFLGPFAPAVAALAITMVQSDGVPGARALVAPVFHWRVGLRWYLFAVTYTIVIKLAAAVMHRAIAGASPRFGHELPIIIAAAVIVSTPFQVGEELGWRGYALPRLAERIGLRRASVLLGVGWACWHLPQFFIREADTSRAVTPLYALQVTALSVAIAWLWAKTHGSLLLPMLMHAAVNNTKDIVPSVLPGAAHVLGLHGTLVGWLTVTLMWVCAAYCLARMPPAGSNPGFRSEISRADHVRA